MRIPTPRYATERRTPTTVIIDEAQDYIAEDRHIAALLAEAAEARIGMMFGMHYLGQLTDTFVKDAVSTNTRIKFAANASTDVPTLARAMHTDADFLSGLPLFTFAYHGPGVEAAIRVKFPLVDFSTMPKMILAHMADDALRARNSLRYSYSQACTSCRAASANRRDLLNLSELPADRRTSDAGRTDPDPPRPATRHAPTNRPGTKQRHLLPYDFRRPSNLLNLNDSR